MFPSHHYTNDSSDILSKHFFNAGATVVPDGRSPSFDDDILPDFMLQQPLPDIIADPNASFKHYTNLDNLNGLLMEDFACAGKKSHGGGGMRSETPDTALLRPKKSLKRDRHSKINTAQGPRDRRMRLSLEIARKFFDLQDVLGFDKPSKTVEWLLRNSSAAIEELSSGGVQSPPGAGASSTSEEAVSSIDIENISELAKTTAALTVAAKPKPSTSSPAAGAFGGGARDKRTKPRKTTSRLPTRESRARARARARARTNYAAAAAATPAPTSTSKGGTAGTLIQNNINPNFAAEVEEIPGNSCTTTEAIFATDCPALGPKWSSSQTIFNFTAGSISHEASSKGEVLERWEDTLHRDHTGNCTKTEMPNFSTNHFVQQQFGDCFQFYGKPWEAYNAPH